MTVKLTVSWPAGKVTVAGAEAHAAYSGWMETVRPPLGAGWISEEV
ncbi:hypothetical protein NR798_10180 [Archangium gephyra]